MWLPWHTLVASASLAHSAYAVHSWLLRNPYYAQLTRLLCTRKDNVLLQALCEFFFEMNGDDLRPHTAYTIVSSSDSEGGEDASDESFSDSSGAENRVRRRRTRAASPELVVEPGEEEAPATSSGYCAVA